MPGPVAHIVLALQVLNGPLKDKNWEQFLIGTSFPDIRYVTALERASTHNQNPSIQAITQETSSFQAGMQFHSLVDKVHGWHIAQNNILNMLPEHPKAHLCFKFFEGMLLKKRVKNWKSVKKIFNQTLEEEKKFGLPEHTIRLWHRFIQLFCQNKNPGVKKLVVTYLLTKFQNQFFKLPDFIRTTIAKTLYKIPLPFMGKTKQFFQALHKNELLKQKILHFYDHFPYYLHAYEQQQAESPPSSPLLAEAI